MALTLTVAPRHHGMQHPQWQHSPPPTPMFPLSFPTHAPPPHSMFQSLAQMQMPTASPAPSASSIASNSTLSSIPAHNTRELTREMLTTVLDHFSTLIPSRFEDRPVRLVVHGGACMLLHPDLDKLAAQTPPFLLLPTGCHNPVPQALQPQPHSTFSPFSLFALSQNPTAPPGASTSPLINNATDNATARPSTPPPDVKRTTTRDVDVITRSFDSEWRQIGITNATELLKECIALTAKKFGLGLDWMNSDPDVALPMAHDPVSNTPYDPIHTDALRPNNISRHTVYTSPNGLLQLISVTPAWAVALKLVRFTKSDPGDICLILRNGTNCSGIKWSEELVETWLVSQCWPMGYMDYDQMKWSQLRGKIKFVVAMVKEYEDAPKKKEMGRTPTPTPARPPPHTVYPYQLPLSYPATVPGFAYNIPAYSAPFYLSSGIAPSPPTQSPPPPPPKDFLQSRTSSFLPRSIAEWGNASKPIPSPAPTPTPVTAGQGREGRAQANRRATDPVIPLLEVETRDRGRSRERRTQSWPLALARDEDKDERDTREGSKESRTRQKVVDWLKANNRHKRKDKHNDSVVDGDGEGDELPVVPLPLLARPSSPPQLRASPPRDLQDMHGPVVPEITVVDSSATVIRSAPSDESDTLTITEKEGESPWHPYHQPAHQRTSSGPDVVIPEHPHVQHQQQPDTYSWIRTAQPPSSSDHPPPHTQHHQQLDAYSWIRATQPPSSSDHPPPLPPKPQPQSFIPTSRRLNEGEGEAFVPPFPLPNNTDDDEDDWESNTLLQSFSSGVAASPLATPGGPPPGFIPYSPGSPAAMPVIIPPTTMSTIPGIVAPVYSPVSYPGHLGSPGYATSGFAGFYGGLAPYQQQHTHTPYNQNQELHGQEVRDKESSNRRGISSWI